MTQASRSITRLLALLVFPITAWGLTTDRNQPITIEADKATLNEKTGSSIYEGNVTLQQGTLHLRGSRMTVQLNNKEVEEIVLTGNPATYHQRPDGKETDQHAEAGRIEYYANDDRMILLDNARIWQSDAEEFRSDRIVFNLKNNTVNAGGDGSSGRVHITLPPTSKKGSGQTTRQQ